MARGDTMNLGTAFGYINQFPWLEPFFQECIKNQGCKDKGWMTAMLKGATRYIAIRPIGELNLNSNPAYSYHYPVPAAEVGVEKGVDMMAFCPTRPGVSFRLSKPSGPQTVTDGSISSRGAIQDSVSATFCYGFFPNCKPAYHFEYLPSTHSIRGGITMLCERYGHIHARIVNGKKCFFDTIEPEAIVVSRCISLQGFGDIFRTFDIWAGQTSMTVLCAGTHRR
jgi:hypothetical protein